MVITELLQTESPKQSARFQTGIAITALFIAVISIALSAILVRFSEREMSAYAIVFNRFWLTAVVLAIWNGLTTLWSLLNSSPTLCLPPLLFSTQPPILLFCQLFAAGICLAADLLLWAWSLTQTSVASASILSNLTPIFTCLIGWLICHKCFDTLFLIGLAIAMSGTIVLGLEDWHVASFKLHGDMAALLAALCFSIYLLIVERLEAKACPTTIILWSSAIAAGLSLPFVIFSSEPLWPISWQGWLVIIILSLICQILGQGLLIYSLNQLSAEFVAIVLLLEPVLAALAAWIVFAEKLSFLNCITLTMILLGIGLASLSQSALKTVVVQSPVNI